MSRLHKLSIINLPTKYFFIIFILLVFGLYKNGFLLISYGYGNYKILVNLIVNIILGLGLGLLYDKLLKQNNFINTAIFLLLLLIIMPISVSPLIYTILVVIYLSIDYFTRKFSFNIIALVKVISFILLNFLNRYNYLNLLEQSGQFNYNFMDTLVGYNVSAIYTSSFILVIAAIIFLLFDKYYKKEIFILGISTYLGSLFLGALFKQDMLFFITNSLNSLVWFGIGIIATIPNFSPLKKIIRYIYGILLGILTVVFSLYFNFYEGVFIAILFLDIIRVLNGLIFKFYVKKRQKNHFLIKQKEEIG